MSPTRKRYFVRFIARILIFVFVLISYFNHSVFFEVLDKNNFFSDFSPFHILWIIWVIDMFLQIIPVKNKVALGSQKLFAKHYRPLAEGIHFEHLKNHVLWLTKGAYKVFCLWTAFIAVIAVLYFRGIIDRNMMFVLSVFFYVCDLICVLIWCPFRLIMKNKCCTTCRIFNWDHMMMFSPLIFVGGFYSWSLVIMAFLAWLVWELCVIIYPERFSEITNTALKCSECTDKLCTQYCRKLR